MIVLVVTAFVCHIVHDILMGRAIKVTIHPITTKNKSNNADDDNDVREKTTDMSSLIVAALCILTQKWNSCNGVNYVWFPYKGHARTGDTIKLLCFISFFGVKPPAI